MKNGPIEAANMFNFFFINIAQNHLNKPIISKISHVLENVSFNECFLTKIVSSEFN